MTELKFYLLCFMIAAPQGALGSAAHSHSGAPISRDARSEDGNNLPPDSEFVETRIPLVNVHRLSERSFFVWTNTPEGCLSKAISRGANAFKLTGSGCMCYVLRNLFCNKWEGETLLYVRKDMLSDGSPSDNATFDVRNFQRHLPDDVLRYYRIESPTILEFGDLREDDDICDQTIQVDSGKSVYVLSHAGIGCKNFPNDYPVADCWAKFTGAGEITLNVTLVNFRESDQCDGFTMTAVTDDANGSSASTDLCDATAPTELTSEGGKVKIEFGASASPTREKYGFNFQVTAA